MSFGRTLRNLGSRASAPAMGKAQSTALGNNTPRNMVRHAGGGSSAGLNAQKTARLQMDGTGYANPALRVAKRNRKAYPKGGRPNLNPRPYYGRRAPVSTFDSRKPKTSIDK